MPVTLRALHGSKLLTEQLCKYITLILVRIIVNLVCLTAFYVLDGRFGHGRFGQDILARYRYKVGRFGQILFQHGKKALCELFFTFIHTVDVKQKHRQLF